MTASISTFQKVLCAVPYAGALYLSTTRLKKALPLTSRTSRAWAHRPVQTVNPLLNQNQIPTAKNYFVAGNATSLALLTASTAFKIISVTSGWVGVGLLTLNILTTLHLWTESQNRGNPGF